MKRRSPRGLDPEERSLWDRVAKTATPLNPKRQIQTPTKPTAPPKIAKPLPSVPAFQIGSNAATALLKPNLAPSITEQVRAQPVSMDKKAFRKLQRGQSKPEARLDLHGMTVAAAHDALLSFVISAHASGKRVVLIITGKGRQADDDGPIPKRVGVLRHQVPQWLSQAPLASLVLQVAHAHQRHGGSGALYVYLRRR